jgi:alkanesulfonate monooxygenase SsuD/methylene tetrahydromethanopterin reductase-like flavin-dependent oxidoreductase (luciferase family)
MSTTSKPMHLAAHFPGVNNTTVWSDPRAGSHIEFSSFVHFAQTAERAKFDFLFLAEGLRLREQGGRIYDLDVVGRPDTFTVLAALAAVIEVTGRQSFVGTPASVADTMNRFVQEDASDGFILVPHITPGGLDEFADTVVPLLQERGVFRADYQGSTLRDHLGLAQPAAGRTATTGSRVAS